MEVSVPATELFLIIKLWNDPETVAYSENGRATYIGTIGVNQAELCFKCASSG